MKIADSSSHNNANAMLAEVPFKCCSKCKVQKSLDNFNNCKKLKYGKHYNCRVCQRLKSNELAREYRKTEAYKNSIEKRREGIKEYQQNYRRQYAEKMKDYFKQYAIAYRKTGKIAEYQKSEKYKKYRSDYDKMDINKKKRHKKYIENLNNWYLKEKLKKKGFTIEQINNNPELLEVQKLIIKTKRLCKTLQS